MTTWRERCDKAGNRGKKPCFPGIMGLRSLRVKQGDDRGEIGGVIIPSFDYVRLLDVHEGVESS
jgi:hypothetical protein